MIKNQRTIKKEFSLSGIGLHTGRKVEMTFKPADENGGITFIRTDFDEKPEIKVLTPLLQLWRWLTSR